MAVTENLARYTKDKAVNLSAMSRAMGLSYSCLYASLGERGRNRPFSIDRKHYILFIEKRIPRSKLNLFHYHKSNSFLDPIPIKISTSTLEDVIGYWLIVLKRYLVKKRNKKRSQARCSDPRNGS